MLNTNFFIPVLLVCAFFLIHKIFLIKQHQRKQKENVDESYPVHDPDFSTIDAQEEAFRKISQEIHDNITLNLSISKLYLSDLDLSNTSELHDRINMALVLLRRGISDLNNLSKSMNPDAVERFGIIKAIEEQVNDIRNTATLSIEFIVTGTAVQLSQGNALILFRIVQESLNNILKHAKATHIIITLEFLQSNLVLFVHDNGCGFNTASQSTAGSGITNMKKRAQMLKAKLEIESTPGTGTSIKVILPVITNPPQICTPKPMLSK